MEVLAPAGGWEALKAAVNAGADAVYFGGSFFNARHYAENFDRQELEKAVDYLHARGRRAYITFNTLIAPAEMAEALQYAVFLRGIGADAVIVQDLGLLGQIQTGMPDLPVHASTQMTVHDAGGVQFLEDLGVSRVVLARELSYEEIKQIAVECHAELEVFVHGALCVAYSGGCLFSSLVGGRSGNRGKCAQPCRLTYELWQDGKALPSPLGDHLLSPKDLCLLADLPKLHEAGVCSLKIEGRMKSPEYVGTVVRVYRQAVDRYLADPEHYQVNSQEMEDLTAVFNRGLTSGYFHHDLDREGMSPGRPSNRGQFIGRVVRYDPKSKRAVLQLQTELLTGDGLEFWVTHGGHRGIVAEDLRLGGRPVKEGQAGESVSLPVNFQVYPNDRVFRTSSVRLRSKPASTDGKVACYARVLAVCGQPLVLELRDNDGHLARAEGNEPLQPAVKHPVSHEALANQLARLGETPFYLAEVQAEISGDPMVPLSLLNQLRREAAVKLEQARIVPAKRPPVKLKQAFQLLGKTGQRRGQAALAVFVGSPEAAAAAAEAGAARVIFGGEAWQPKVRWDGPQLSAAAEACRKKDVLPVFALPRISRPRDREWLQNYCRQAESLGAGGLLLGHPGQLALARTETSLPLYANHTFNLFNPAAVWLMAKQGLAGVTLSPELTMQQARAIWELAAFDSLDLELVVHGALELMISQFCPVGVWTGQKQGNSCPGPCRQGEYWLKDRKGYLFPVWTDQFCRAHILNSVDLVLVGDLAALQGQKLILRLELRERSPREVAETLRLYQAALAGAMDKEELLETAHQISGRRMTRGHYFREVE
ncbi:MAG TPA: U32 family peptidase [Firmicutes bacterium]|jgi:putative protease|nr:U32 family peptidase [Bacillota bacterium]HOQ24582.1 DUF3656 domain-containing protein [Bacillota bacterium]HPT67834.1 DUF3656 domain-containing protein [Bacillota bacterium]